MVEKFLTAPSAKDKLDIVKVLALSAVETGRKMIGYSALLSMLALIELFRTATTLMRETGNVAVFFIVIFLYLALSIAMRAAYKLLERVLYRNDSELLSNRC